MPIGERQPRPEKVTTVAELKEILNAGTVILTDFQGMDVKTMFNMRRKLRAAGSGYRVVKNTLFRLATEGTNASQLAEGLVGSTAFVYSDEDPVQTAKAMMEFCKGPKAIKIKAGVVDGHLLTGAQVTELSKLPSKQELYAMVVGGLQSPITNLVGTLQATYGQLVLTLNAIAEKQTAA